jgi:hypothetical protein
MEVRRKRPLGITLLALSYLWAGCVGTLAVLMFLLTGAAGQIADALLADHIPRSALRVVVATFLSLACLGLYVLHAWIGFSLMRLRQWAWRASIVLQQVALATCVVAGFVIAATVMKRPLLGIPLSVGLMAPFAGMLWYLYRTHVRAAFLALRPVQSIAGVVPPPPMPTREKPLWLQITVICVACFALFAMSVMILVESMFRSSEIYAITLKEAQRAPCVISKLGTPVTAGWMISGSMSESSVTGVADLQIPVRGPKGKAELQVSAKKDAGSWVIASLILDQSGDQTQVLPTNQAADCR